MSGPCFCVKPLQSSSGRLGKEGKRTRGPFSATRTSWKLKLDGFSSSRGALQDPHNEKAPSSKKPGGRWAAAPRTVRRRAWRHLRHFCRSSLSLRRYMLQVFELLSFRWKPHSHSVSFRLAIVNHDETHQNAIFSSDCNTLKFTAPAGFIQNFSLSWVSSRL